MERGAGDLKEESVFSHHALEVLEQTQLHLVFGAGADCLYHLIKQIEQAVSDLLDSQVTPGGQQGQAQRFWMPTQFVGFFCRALST